MRFSNQQEIFSGYTRPRKSRSSTSVFLYRRKTTGSQGLNICGASDCCAVVALGSGALEFLHERLLGRLHLRVANEETFSARISARRLCGRRRPISTPSASGATPLALTLQIFNRPHSRFLSHFSVQLFLVSVQTGGLCLIFHHVEEAPGNRTSRDRKMGKSVRRSTRAKSCA